VGLAHRAHLAEALLWAGQPAAALEVASRALQQAAETGEAAFAAELHRVAGEACAQLGSHPDAARCLEQAVAVASRQGAWLFVLRGACAVVRLEQAAGAVGADARDRLAQACARFSPTLEVGDLHDARNLLVTGA
jgi:predicted ATPase